MLIIAANVSTEPLQFTGLFMLIGVATTLVWILFLAAFAMGLPARAERPVTAEVDGRDRGLIEVDRPAATPPGSAGG